MSAGLSRGARGALPAHMTVGVSDRVGEAWRASRLTDLPEDLQAKLIPDTRSVVLDAGERLRWDDPILGVVAEGLLCIFMASRGRQAAIRYIGPGEMFGLPSVISPETAYGAGLELRMRAVTDTRLLELPTRRFRALASKDARAAWTISQWIVDDMVAGHAVLADDVFLSVRQLLARHLLDLAQREGNELIVRVTQEDLADAIGSVRAVVARSLGQLREEGLIARTAKGLLLADPGGLHALASGGDE